MSVPDNHLAVINAQESNYGRWLEIEGIPYAYGTFTRAADFFTPRSATQEFLGVKPYLMTVPKLLDQKIDTLDGGAQTAGAVNFELGDIDGSLAQLCGIGYQTGFTALRAEITKTDTSIPFPAGGAGAFSAGGYLYIGTETILIGAINNTTHNFTGCTRGMFRSTPQAFGVGIPIGTRPYTMASRKCWYNQVGLAGQGRQAATGFVDADRCVRFGGLATNFVSNEPNKFVLTCKSMDEELNRQVFRGLRNHPLQAIFMPADPKDDDSDSRGQIQVSGWPGFFVFTGASYGNNRDFPCPLTTAGLPLYSPGERSLVRIDNEILMVLSLANGQLEYQQRAMCGTQAARHEKGANVQELVSVMEYRNAFGMEWTSKFDAVCPTGVHADHPLALVLQVLLSVNGDGTNGPYDVLPDWGLGIDESRVDVQGIEQVMLEEPSLRFGGVISKQVNFLQFARELLAFSGYYHFVAIGDEFRIRRLRPPEPDATDGVREVVPSGSIRNRTTIWESNWSGAVREVLFTYGYNIITNDYKIIDIYKLAGGDLYSKGQARTITYPSTLLYPGKSGIPGEPPFDRFDIRSWLTARGEFFKVRYGRPPPIITKYLTYRFIDLQVGDLCIVTDPDVPSTSTGSLGMVEEIGEVISVSIDDVSKTVTAQILMTGYQIGSYRYISPSLEMQSVSAYGSAMIGVFKANSFTEATGPHGNTQNDAHIENSSGDLIETFPVGTHVRIWSPTFDESVTGIVDSVDLVTRDIEIGTISDDGVPIDAGWFVVFDNYSTSAADDVDVVTAAERYAYGADSSDLLGSGNDAAHKLFPT